MTFRPSDDVLEQMADSQNSQTWTSQYYTYDNGYNTAYNAWNQSYWQQDFQQTQNFGDEWPTQWSYSNSLDWWVPTESAIPTINIPIEEVKAPDLSDLLKKSEEKNINNASPNINSVQESPNDVFTTPSVQTTTPQQTTVATPSVQTTTPQQTVQQLQKTNGNSLDIEISGGITDVERTSIVSWIDWSISSNLDFLVNEQWSNAVMKYKKLNHLFFRRWLIIFSSIIWLFFWVFAQVNMDHSHKLQIINNSSIQNKAKWNDNNTSDIVLKALVDSWVNLEVLIPYGSASVWTNNYFQSKSNLLKYNWLILPQLASINYSSTGFISLEKFINHEASRDDLENTISYIIKDRNIWNNTRNLTNNFDSEWVPNIFSGWLIEWFSLWCIDKYKISDVLCDNFLDIFNKYGKYYELSKPEYSSEILWLVKKLREQWKTIEPICTMINDYVLHVGIISDDFDSVMQYCNQDDYDFYKKLVNFIDLENSLLQPELSDKVFDNPDLNAYKLLSAQQIAYNKMIKWTTLNENFIKSYLNFVQALLNKDNKTNRYLAPIYKDLLYVFNNDELYQKILENWKTELKMQMDQINNGNPLYRYPWLLSQLTTPNIIQSASDLSGTVIEELTIEDIFSQYYSMTDRLKIRSVNKISDNELVVKTELFTNKILSVTDDETLKLTVSLHRKDNVLYVDNIKVADQPRLSEILNIQASDWTTSFNSMLGTIDDQVGMRYELAPEEGEEEQLTFCEQIQEREDLSVYNCDDSSISLYKWEVEYNFALINGTLDSFTISDKNLENLIKDKLNWVMFMKDNTPTIIESIINFTVETTKDDSLEKKLEIIDQFRIHFKMIPDDIRVIDGDSDNFLIDFTLWEFKLQSRYNVDSHLLTNISYVNCEKTLEIRWLTIPITTENEPQLIEILNNPRVFFVKANQAAYKKYQNMCNEDKEEKK